MTNNVTINQHIIPASYILLFSSDNNNRRLRERKLYSYDNKSGKILNQKAEDIQFVSEKYYFDVDDNTIDFSFEKNIIENNLKYIENEFKEIVEGKENIKKIIDKNKKIIILEYMLHIYLRTKRIRKLIQDNFIKQFDEKYKNNENIKQHKKQIKENGLNPNSFDKINTEQGKKEIAKQIHSISTLGTFTQNEIYINQRKIFEKYYYHVFHLDNNKEFISSDNPVVYGSNNIIFPINNKNCLIGVNKNYNKKKEFTPDLINTIIASNSDNIIYASKENIIDEYKCFLDKPDLPSLKDLDI